MAAKNETAKNEAVKSGSVKSEGPEETREETGPARADQVLRCPRCGHHEVPAGGGTRRKTDGVYRYRRCARCRHTFVTRERHGGGAESVLG